MLAPKPEQIQTGRATVTIGDEEGIQRRFLMPNESCVVDSMRNVWDRLDSITARKLYGCAKEMSDSGRRLLPALDRWGHWIGSFRMSALENGTQDGINWFLEEWMIVIQKVCRPKRMQRMGRERGGGAWRRMLSKQQVIKRVNMVLRPRGNLASPYAAVSESQALTSIIPPRPETPVSRHGTIKPGQE
ncbi:hypothetical protein BOTBODRAFT_46813 [Botryobasidium botryosum FD-172 SS1]|uniref:Uncharacterized protein n=1 Tax=Botryobasidium botryosum (strain FD-172 SS1) TaxID=930990 RepID=A0A067M4S4_BOTB1|nr:hypothetical protein BOTBODRAFT_46813 [Botryobasidium botryosum FD-172 SS1]